MRIQHALSIILALFFSTNVFSQTITVTGSTTFCAGGSVLLTAPAGTAFQWQQGSNAIPGETTQNYTATTSGNYWVIVTIAGTPTNSDTVAVTVNPNPAPDFTSANNVCSGTAVQFNSNINTGTPPYTYSWHFGDATSSNQASPSHIFISLGCGTQVFQDTLTVTDANGCSGRAIHPVTILQAPNVQLQDTDPFTPFSNCDHSPTPANPNFTLTVNNISPSVACITSYTLNWGDGLVETGLNSASFPRTHTYTQLGAFNLTITAVGTNGCSQSKNYVVANQTNPAGGLTTLGGTAGLCTPASIRFVIDAWYLNSPGTTYHLDFGDGNSVVLPHPLNASLLPDTITHIYTRSSCPQSAYTAKLTVINACDSTAYTASNIQIRKQPEAHFTIPLMACAGQNVCFGDSTILGDYGPTCSNTTAYSWNFGDVASGGNNTSSLASPCHVFATPGTYTVTLTTSNPCGGSTATRQVCVTASPSAAFSVATTSVCVGTTVAMTNTSLASTCGPTNYSWTVGYTASFCGTSAAYSFVGGTSATSTNPSFVFNNPGTYTVTLAITSPCGNTTAQQIIKVKQKPLVTLPVIADACGQVNVCPAPTVSNCGETTLSYQWLFDGGALGSSTNVNPGCVLFSTVGVHTVLLAVTNECGTTMVTRQFTVNGVADLSIPAATSFCPGVNTGSFNFSSLTPGATITWTNSNTLIGLGASGSGNIPSFVTINSGSSPAIATISVTAVANGCSRQLSFTITVNPNPSLPAVTSPVNYCVNAGANSLTATPTPGNTLLWYSSPTGGTGTVNAPVPSTSTVGTTNFYVSQVNSATICESGRALVTVNVYATPDISSSNATNPTACASATGSITLGGLTPSATYIVQYLFNGSPVTISVAVNSSGNIIIGGLASGVYNNIHVTLSGCLSNNVGPFTLTDPNPPATPTAGANGPICARQNLILTSASTTPGVSYSWTGPNGFTSNQQNPVITNVTTAATGTYFVTAILNNCQSAPGSVAVLIYGTPIVQAAPNAITVCSGDNINLQSSSTFPGTITYSWTGPGGFISTDQNPVIPSATTTMNGIYTVVATSALGNCQSPPANVNVVVHQRPNITNSSSANPSLCGSATGSITLNGMTPSTSYAVNYIKNGTAASATIIADASGNVVIPGLTAATYTNISVTLNSCVSNLAGPFTLTDPNPPASPVVSSNAPICQGGSLQLNAGSTAGSTYLWTGPNGFTSNQQNPVISNVPTTANGTYFVTAVLNNCQSVPGSVNVLIYGTPTVQAVPNAITVCSGDNINLQSSSTFPGTITYSWTGPVGFTSTDQNPAIPNANTTMNGAYTVLATSVLGNCQSLPANVNVVVHQRPNITNSSSVNPSLCGSATGSITLNGMIPSTSYTVNYIKDGTAVTATIIANGSGNVVITGLTAATYTNISVTLNLCTSNLAGPFTLTDPNPPASPIVSSNAPICQGENLQLNAGSAAGSTYLWTGPNGFTSSQQNPLINSVTLTANGVYNVTATLNNCHSLPASITVLINPRPAAPTVSPNLTVCAMDTIRLTSSSTFTGALTYSWSGPNGFTSTLQNPVIANASVGMIGVYSLTVTSVQGSCQSAVSTMNVSVLPLPVVTTTSHINPIGCGTPTGSIILNGLTPGGTYVVYYSLNGGPIVSANAIANGAGAIIINNLVAGVYTNVTVTQNGCRSNTAGPFMLKDTAPFSVLAENNGPVCESSSLLLNADITTTGGATYAWNGPNGFTSNIQSPFIVNATSVNNGIYYVAVTVDGCTSTDSVTVTVSEHSVGGFTGPDATACRGNNSGLIHLSGNFGEITRWEVSINNGLTWAPVNNNGFFMSYSDLTTTTLYRAVVQNGACPPMNSNITKISVVNSVQSVSITPDSVGTCIHDTTILFTANPVYTGTDPVSYYWYVNGQIQGTTNPFTWHIQVPVGDLSTRETTIKVLAENSLGCGDTSLAAKVIIYPFPVITKTKSNDISCYWGTSNLNVTGADHYFWWSSDSSISDPHASSITVAPKESSTYYFRAISANGCIKEDSIRVLVDKNIAHGQFNVPNAFTPNGDGLNDQFCVSGFTRENYELLIYDRPGKLLFRTTDPSKCWDGTFNGKQQPLGVYVYWLKAKTVCDEGAFHKGYIVLIR